MERINIAELLKDCPKGMELDCTMFRGLEFVRIDEYNKPYPIICRVKTEFGSYNVHTFTEHGSYGAEKYSKCVIFPKGKTTWEGFMPPYQFKDGGILATDLGSVFYLNTRLNTDEYYGCYVGIGGDGSFHICEPFAYKECCGFATEEEKQKLFDAIKANGYKWNEETKSLEKLPRFKMWDKIRHKNDKTTINTICCIYDDSYRLSDGHLLFFKDQYQYELVPNKFDINTLKPFESKVLVRDMDNHNWVGAFYSHYKSKKFHIIGDSYYLQCIPYKGNEHLLDTTNDCNEYYKTWG